MQTIISWFARNPVAANLLMVCILAFGASSLLDKLVIEVFPEFESQSVVITVSYPGATPGQVEESITLPIEEAVYQIEGIESMKSVSSENQSRIVLEVLSGYEVSDVHEEVKQQVEAITTFPDDAKKPVYTLASFKRQVIDVVLYGNIDDRKLVNYAQQVREELLALGLNYVQIESERNYELAIEIPQENLERYNLAYEQVASAIRKADSDSAAGNITTSKGEILLRTKSEITDAGDIAAVVVKQQSDGRKLTIADIARLRNDLEESRIQERFNGKPAVNISVYRSGDESALEISEKVRQYAENWQGPAEIAYTRDFSKVLRSRMELLLTNAFYGFLLVILILSIFLRPSIAFWVSLGIPISFMGGLAFMPILGITINMISMFAFILVLGIVVDDAIITGESVYSRLRSGGRSPDAIIRGTMDISVPVVFGVLTTVVAFYPLSTVDGRIGTIFLQIPAIVCPVLIFSLIESMLILPAHLRHVQVVNTPRNMFLRMQDAVARGLEAFVATVYQPWILFCLKHRYTTLVFFLAISSVIMATLASGWMRFTFLPSVPSESLRASLTMPAGTVFSTTAQYIARLEQAAEKMRDEYNNDTYTVIENILSVTRDTKGFLRLELASPENRPAELTNQRLLREWRRNAGKLEGVEQLSFSGQIGRFSTPVSFQLSSHDIASMKAVSDKLQQAMHEYPNLHNIRDDFASGKEELQVRLLPQAATMGITLESLSQQVRERFYGKSVISFFQDQKEIQVVLRSPAEERNNFSTLNNMLVMADSGSLLPLAEVAVMTSSRSPTAITREERQRIIHVEADADRQKANLVAIRSELAASLDDILADYPQVTYKQRGESRDLGESLDSVFKNFLVVIFIMYGLLAVPLRSYFKPLIVLFIIPFAVSYAVAGHLIMGLNLSLMSIMGMIALSGVALNDALILVVFINRQIANGVDVFTAASTAGRKRFRAVLLTSLTTFFGLLPLMFETSTQAQFILPTGVSLGWGILFTTFATLVLIPVFYVIVYDVFTLFSPTRTARSAT